MFPESTEKVLRVQRLLSGLPGRWSAGLGRPSLGVARRAALERFLHGPAKVGRPASAVVRDRHQLKFPI